MRREQKEVREPGAEAQVRASRDSKEAGVMGPLSRASSTPSGEWREAEWRWAGGQGGRQAGKASWRVTALAWYLSDKDGSTPYHTPSCCCPIPGEPD